MAFLHNFSSSSGNSKSVKLFALGLLFILIGTQTTSAQFAGGSGTEADPYQISTPSQLDSVRYFLTSHFELINDIDLSYATGNSSGEFWNDGEGWEPIHKGGSTYRSFSGSLNGNNYTINGLIINRNDPVAVNSYVGLFSFTSFATVQNLNIIDANIHGDTSVGILGGYLDDSFVTNVFVSGVVKGRAWLGGLAGIARDTKISKGISISNINISPPTGYSEGNGGGLIGTAFGGVEVYDSYSSGNVESILGSQVGGLIGASFSDLKLKRSYSLGEATGDRQGGLIQNSFDSSAYNYWNTETSNLLVSGVGIGLNTNQMLDSTNFTGFDFENTWDIIQGYSFPYLRDVGNHLASVHQITGSEGWRLISAPLDSITYGALLDSLWTQGFTNADYESGTPNVYTRNEVSGTWVAISDSADIAPAGEGILVYVYADDDFDGTSDGFPKTLIVQGSQRTTSLTKTLDLTLTGSGTSYDAANDGWNFIGNPFAYPISWDELSGWAKTGLEGSIYIWNNTANEYQSWNGSSGTLPNDGIIPPFQGFWVKANNTGTPSITITPDARTTGGALLKKAPVPTLNMTISDGFENSSLSSNSTIAFLDHASVGQDDWDAWKLQPMSSDFLSSFTTTNEGASLDINSLPLDLSETVEIPLDYKLNTNSTIDELSISWELDHFPNDWSFTLLDQETGSLIDMNSNSSYQFGNVINRKEKSKQDDFMPIHRVLVNNDGRQKGIESSRFFITISPGSALSNGEESELPNQYFLSQNYPNPFNPSTVISFQLPENTRVSLRVFDMLGREVAMLVNGQVEAGYHSVNFDAGNLASGVYIYRLETGIQIMTKKMTLIK